MHPETAGRVEDVGQVAPEAGHLLTAAFPALSLDEANLILTETQGPGGGFLDDGSEFGVYSRLDLYPRPARPRRCRRAGLGPARRADTRSTLRDPAKPSGSAAARDRLGTALQRNTPSARARWMPRTSLPFLRVRSIGCGVPDTQILSSASRSNVPAVSTEKRTIAR